MSDFLPKAAAMIGAEGVITAGTAMAPYLAEARGLQHGQAEAVLVPPDRERLAALVALCHSAAKPMVVQGGNTGLVGGGLPFGGVVISTRKLNRVLALDTANATLTVEAGVTLHAAREAARAAGFLFPLSLGSQGSCTLGGNIATNAGGTAVLRYGSMRDLVLGLEVVLADGRVLDALSGLRKDNAGYDLKSLFIGSEGTLGIVTAAVLKLFPLPRSRATAFIGVPGPVEAVALFNRLRAQADTSLTTFEILPRFGLETVLVHAPGARDPLPEPHPWYVLAELTAPQAEDTGLETVLMTTLEEAMVAGEVSNAALAQTQAQADAFWALRENLSECQRQEGGSIKHDISVPISAIAAFIDTVSAQCVAFMPGLRPCIFGHIGDGNLHFNLSQPVGMDKAAFLQQWEAFNRIVHDAVAAAHGSIAAEHGVGLFKREELRQYKSPVALAMMADLKRALDPLNLLNPGKVVAMGGSMPAFKPGAGSLRPQPDGQGPQQV